MDKKFMTWLSLFDDRQKKEIEFSILYSKEFNHGTDGHNAKLLIAKMADLLTKLEIVIQNPQMSDEEILRDILEKFTIL